MVIAFACLGSFAAGIAVGLLIYAYKLWKLYTIFDESCVENNKNNAWQIKSSMV